MDRESDQQTSSLLKIEKKNILSRASAARERGEQIQQNFPMMTDAGPGVGTFCCRKEAEMSEETLFPVVVMPTEERERREAELVQFRISLISPAIYHTHTYPSDRAYFLAVSEKTYTLPDGRVRTFSVKTLERWLRKYKAYGAEGLQVKPRSDLGSSRTLTLDVMVRIAEIVKEVPQIKCTVLLRRLEDKEKLLEKGSVSADTIRRFIKMHDLRDPVVCEERIRKSFVVDNAGDLFEADTCYLFKIPNAKGELKWVYIQGIMDDHSRRIVSAICYMKDTAENFQKTLFHAISGSTIPTALYADNGSPYICTQLKQICNRLGITLIHTRASDGASKGCIERYWLTAVMNMIPDLVLDKVTTLEGVQKVVDEHVEKYNNSLNRGVNGIPNERFQASLMRKPVRRPQSLEWLRAQFVNSKWCHLYNDNVIHFNCKHYRIPDELVLKVRQIYGKKVPICYDPNDIDGTICVILGEYKHTLSIDNPKENSKQRRNTGGRKEQLAEKAAVREKKRISIAEQRAEDRYRKRMAGIRQEENDEILPALPNGDEIFKDAAEKKTELLHLDYTMI